MARQSWLLGRWLLLAFLMEALITLYIPQEAIAAVLGEGNAFAIPLAALIGIPLYVSNFSALPIVSGLLAQGMQSGAAIAFPIAGPVTTIPAITAVYGVVQKRVFVLYISIGLFGAMIMGLATNRFARPHAHHPTQAGKTAQRQYSSLKPRSYRAVLPLLIEGVSIELRGANWKVYAAAAQQRE